MTAAIQGLRRVFRPLPWRVLTLLVGALFSTTVLAQPFELPRGYTLVWADEFEGTATVDSTRWAHDTFRNKEGWFNNELQYYAGPRPENARVQNGRLVLQARKESLS